MIDILFWIIFGLIIGWFMAAYNREHNTTRIIISAIFGVAGAMLGGFMARIIAGGMNEFNPSSILMAAIGAVCLTCSYHSIRRRT